MIGMSFPLRLLSGGRSALRLGQPAADGGDHPFRVPELSSTFFRMASASSMVSLMPSMLNEPISARNRSSLDTAGFRVRFFAVIAQI